CSVPSWLGARSSISSNPVHPYKTSSSASPTRSRRRTSMRKLMVIASREYQAAVRTKSFLISLLILPLMMGGSLLVQYLFKDKVDITEKHFAVVDHTPGQNLATKLLSKVEERNQHAIRDAADKQIQPE